MVCDLCCLAARRLVRVHAAVSASTRRLDSSSQRRRRPQQTAARPTIKSEKKLTPEEKMARRFPQPVRVGYLIGLPVLDWQRLDDRLHPAGRSHPGRQDSADRALHRWFGWVGTVRLGWTAGGARWRCRSKPWRFWRGRWPRSICRGEEFDAAPTFMPSQATPVSADETIRIAHHTAVIQIARFDTYLSVKLTFAGNSFSSLLF